MTNSASPAEPANGLLGEPASGDAAALSPKPAAKPLRTGPRRASSPAGAPGRASGTRGILLVGADGLIVGPPAAARQAEDAVQPATDDAVTHLPKQAPPARLAGSGDEAEGESVDESEHGSATDAAEGEAEGGAAHGSQADADAADASGKDNADDTPEPESGPDDATSPEAAEAGQAAEQTAFQAAESDAQPVPLTRRARRLAEDGSPAVVVPGVAAKGELPEKAVDTAAGKTPAPTAKSRTAGRAWVRGLLFTALVAAMVLGLGTVISGQDPGGGASATEINREQSWAQTAALLAQAQALRDAEPDTAAKTLLKQGAEALQTQLAALAGGQAAISTAPATSTAAGATTAGFAEALAGSANTLLADSLTADGAMGRVFAAAGTSRLLLASTLDRQLGKSIPPSPYLPVAVPQVPDAAPSCKSTKKPQPGASADAALTTAAQAEQKAVYAYQVAGSRLAEPGFSRAVGLAAVHQDRLDLLNSELARRCLPVVSPVPGFALDLAFTEAPASALAKLEGQLVLVYGDVAALSAPAKHAAALPSPTEALATAAPPSVARASSLREIAVAGLVESAAKVQEWGGAVGALPGIPDAPRAIPPAVPASVPAKP